MAVMKRKLLSRDERMQLADLNQALRDLKERHGARITAHLLYHQARTLTREADRDSENESREQS